MKRDYSVPLAVQMAEEVLNMHHELERLREECAELREYRDKYIDEMNRGIAHSQHMIGGLLELAMKPGVLDAVAAANERA
jgi:hypothetical protein